MLALKLHRVWHVCYVSYYAPTKEVWEGYISLELVSWLAITLKTKIILLFSTDLVLNGLTFRYEI